MPPLAETRKRRRRSTMLLVSRRMVGWMLFLLVVARASFTKGRKLVNLYSFLDLYMSTPHAWLTLQHFLFPRSVITWGVYLNNVFERLSPRDPPLSFSQYPLHFLFFFSPRRNIEKIPFLLLTSNTSIFS